MSDRHAIAPLALTIGEPAGIGPELAAMAFLQRRVHDLPPFVLVGDGDLVAARARDSGLGGVPIREIETTALDHANTLFADALPVIALQGGGPVRAGQLDVAHAALVIESIETSVRLAHAGHVSAVVTNPIQKETLYAAGFAHPGHTEFLGQLARDIWGTCSDPVMMLASDELRVVPVTIHIPLKDVCGALTSDLIAATITTVIGDLKTRFGIANPRIAVAGLNPHAGEGGTIGREDMEIIAPAIAQLRAQGHDLRGPLSADTLFHARARATYDAAVCMYHDQALIPIKTIAFDSGVNVTLGLPFIRTSPDHGTALDIAGTGTANPASLIAALRMAAGMAARSIQSGTA